MNFSKILSKSFENVKRFKYLWGLGILAMLTQAGSGFNGYSFNSPSLEQKEIPDVNISRFTGWIQAHAAEVIVLAVIMLIIAIVLVYLSLRAQAGQIVAIAQIEKDKPIKNFKAAFSAGRGFAWELFWLSTLSFAIFILFIAITFVLPAALMVEIQATIVYVFGGLLIFLGFVGGFILLVWLAVGVQLGQREIVLKDKGILYSLEEGMRLAKHNAGSAILAVLIEFGLSILIGIAVMIALFIVGGILGLVGYGIYSAFGESVMIVYSIALGLPFLAVMLIIGGMVTSFWSSYWTLIYLQLKR